MGNNIEKNLIARVTYEKTLRASPNKKSGKAATIQVFPAWGRGTASAALGCFRMQHKCTSLSPILPIYLSYHVCPIRPCEAPSPTGEGCDTRIPSSKKGSALPLVNLSAPQAPSSRAKPRDLYCTAAICTHAPSLKRHLGASFFAFPSPTVYRSAKKIPLLRPS